MWKYKYSFIFGFIASIFVIISYFSANKNPYYVFINVFTYSLLLFMSYALTINEFPIESIKNFFNNDKHLIKHLIKHSLLKLSIYLLIILFSYILLFIKNNNFNDLPIILLILISILMQILLMYCFFIIAFILRKKIISKIITIFLILTNFITIYFDNKLFHYINIFSFHNIDNPLIIITKTFSLVILLFILSILFDKNILIKLFKKNLFIVISIIFTNFLLYYYQINHLNNASINLSLLEQIKICFSNIDIFKNLNIHINFFITIIIYMFMMTLIIFSIIYTRKNDSKLICFIFHKNNIVNNMLFIYKDCFKTIFISFVSFIFIHVVFYLLNTANNNLNELSFVIIYFLKINLLLYIFITLYEIFIIFNHENIYQYIAILVIYAIIYLDFINKSNIFIIGNDLINEIQATIKILIISIISNSILYVILKRKKDLL